MQHALVMTVIGQDRPGLVDSVAALVAQHGGNWLESRMSRLGGQFAGILRVEIPKGNEPKLVEALKGLADRGLTVVVSQDTAPQKDQVLRYSVLEIVGQDRPGIVSQIARVLAENEVNVEELHTECASAAMSGETLFKAHARLGIPENSDSNAVRKRLEELAEDLMVEISLEELRPD
jgi:glycine cleavage system regulatory protein